MSKDQIFTLSLPVDQSRVKLLPIEDDESSDYINANYMPVSSCWASASFFALVNLTKACKIPLVKYQ